MSGQIKPNSNKMNDKERQIVTMYIVHTLQAKLWGEAVLHTKAVSKEMKRQIGYMENHINKLHRFCELDFDLILEESCIISENIEKLMKLSDDQLAEVYKIVNGEEETV